MSNIFQSVGVKPTRKSKFSLSHDVKYTTRMGLLTPFYIQETLPGDSFRGKAETLIRFAPLLNPIYENLTCYMHYFFVPNRLLFNKWDEFITGGKDGTETPVPPQVKLQSTVYDSFKTGRLGEYLGVPTDWAEDGVSPNEDINSMPFTAYHLIYDEFYRDQDLEDPVSVEAWKDEGVQTDPTGIGKMTSLRYSAWPKDYFTSARPWPQKGPDVEIPLATGSEAVNYKPITDVFSSAGNSPGGATERRLMVNPGGQAGYASGGATDSRGQDARFENIDSIGAGIDVNDLRRSSALQKFLETNARAGSRYTEWVQAHFQVRGDDLRLHRPAFISGAKFSVKISEIMQTANDDLGQGNNNDFRGVGNFYGHGISYSDSAGFSYQCKEHGFIMGIMRVIPQFGTYYQGLPRMFSRIDKLDYYIPEFAQLGEQEVKEKELFLYSEGDKDKTFGYQTRYAEYKYTPSRIVGDFKDHLSLGSWHVARNVSSNHDLNDVFVKTYPQEFEKIFTVQQSEVDGGNYDELWCYTSNNISAVRPMPYIGIPELS